MDITYIPMARRFAYLAAVIDWFSRKVCASIMAFCTPSTAATPNSAPTSTPWPAETPVA
jgi:transposase InsO family protein